MPKVHRFCHLYIIMCSHETLAIGGKINWTMIGLQTSNNEGIRVDWGFRNVEVYILQWTNHQLELYGQVCCKFSSSKLWLTLSPFSAASMGWIIVSSRLWTPTAHLQNTCCFHLQQHASCITATIPQLKGRKHNPGMVARSLRGRSSYWPYMSTILSCLAL